MRAAASRRAPLIEAPAPCISATYFYRQFRLKIFPELLV